MLEALCMTAMDLGAAAKRAGLPGRMLRRWQRQQVRHWTCAALRRAILLADNLGARPGDGAASTSKGMGATVGA